MLQLGILASGSGSNARAILDAAACGQLQARIRVVISNRPNAGVLEHARAAHVPAVCIDHTLYPTREAFDAAIVTALHEYRVDTVAMAGFMRLITPVLLSAFPGRILNIHPALLPAFPGVRGAGDASDYGVKIAGCSVHFVDLVMDHGPVIIQAAVPAMQNDSAEDLQQRILAFEHRIYPQALQWFSEQRLSIQGRRVFLSPPTQNTVPSPVANALVAPPLERF